MLKRENFRLIILFIALTVIAMIAVQIYWIDNAITLKEEEFGESVNKSIKATSKTLEHHSALSYLGKSSFGNRFFQGFQPLSGIYPYGNEKIIRKDTLIEKNGEMMSVQLIEKENSDSTRGFRTKERFFSHIVQNSFNKKTGEASFNVYVDDSIRLYFKPEFFGIEGQGNNRAMMNDMLSDLFATPGIQPNNKRVNLKELDSILLLELTSRGIEAEYQFMITNLKGEGVLFRDSTSEKNAEEIRASGYSINLFPGDFINEPLFLFVHFPKQRSYLLGRMWTILSVSGMLILIIIGAFYYMISTILKQKKFSEIRNDFISNMTHELKTPISTIALASEVLGDRDVLISDQQKSSYIQMIRDENKRLGVLVESVLQTAIIERGELKLKFEEIEINELINDMVSSFDIQVKKRGGHIQTRLNSTPVKVQGDRVHLTNVLFNLLDNANKYSFQSPEITITSSVQNNYLVVRISDKGIGITRENQKKIFEQLYRVPSGNVHNVKGFGLGLAYVKAIVEKHKGNVLVESEPGNGSIFTIEIPLNHD